MEVTFQTEDGEFSGSITMGSIPAEGMRFVCQDRHFKVIKLKLDDNQYSLTVREVKPLENIAKGMRAIRP